LSAAAEGTGTEIVITDSTGPGWQLISAPVQVPCPVLLPRSFLYERIYRQSDTLVAGRGYWNKLSGEKLSFAGTALLEETISVAERWNLVGSISHPVAVGSISSDPPGIVTSQFYGFHNNYYTTDSIRPGKAYWVKASQNGSLILSSSGLIQSSSRIRIVTTDELPPPVPAPSVSNPSEGILTGKPRTPICFALDQNYPNPFNPLTFIRYQLPVDSYVTLRVYNMLGQEVSVLVNEFEVSGFKSVEWDAGQVPSGDYFYKLTTGGFTDVKKLVLVR
jgi:hypothetical protein